MNKERLITLAAFVFAAAASRLLPHAPNFTPVAAIALFAGAKFDKRWQAFAVPFVALLLSDAVIGFYSGMWVNYLAFAAVVLVGFALRGRQRRLRSVLTASVVGAFVFFFISNLSVWVAGELFPHTFDGLVQSIVAGIPFFANTLLSDLFYTALMFGGFALAEQKFTRLREEPVAA